VVLVPHLDRGVVDEGVLGHEAEAVRGHRHLERLSVGNVWSARNSFLTLWWKRSIFPVVVGVLGAVRRCEMPFSRHMRSKSTSALWVRNDR
jgi:hypothetical protein